MPNSDPSSTKMGTDNRSYLTSSALDPLLGLIAAAEVVTTFTTCVQGRNIVTS